MYTHTLFWAVCDIDTAKNNGAAAGFSNEFDRLMQFMNYRETNGICIGPEVSRIFAEIILSEIDSRAINALRAKRVFDKIDFEFRRYVDDYYLFCRDISIADKVSAAIGLALGEFNLHLNEAKTSTLARPFATSLSRVISDTNKRLGSLFEKVLDYKTSADPVTITRFGYPKAIYRSDVLLRSTIKDVKSICSMHGSGYEVVSDYIVSAATIRVVDLADGYIFGISLEGVDENEYVSSIMFLLEVIYFFYTVNPTVRASLNVAKAVIVAVNLFRDKFPERYAFLSESVVRWTVDLARSMTAASRHSDLNAVPVEVLNILLPMREVAFEEPLVDELVGSLCEEVESFEYFQIISFLFVVGSRPQHQGLVRRLFMQAKAIVLSAGGPLKDSHATHLSLDLLTCPYIPVDQRATWFNVLRKLCGLGTMAKAQAQAVVAGMEQFPWFVRWEGVDLLSILKKKELSSVY
jgi:hypothetical protein